MFILQRDEYTHANLRLVDFPPEQWVWSTPLAKMSSTRSAGGLTNYRRSFMIAGKAQSSKTVSLDLPFRVMTNKVLAKAIEQARVPPLAFVSMSGVAYYPPSTEGSPPHTEQSSGGKHDFMARLARDWEEAAVLPHTADTRCVQLRSGVVLGRNGGMVQQTILPFFFGLGGRMGSGQQAMPWIHVKDLADLSIHCLESPKCSGVYNAVAPDIVTNSQFVKAFAGALK